MRSFQNTVMHYDSAGDVKNKGMKCSRSNDPPEHTHTHTFMFEETVTHSNCSEQIRGCEQLGDEISVCTMQIKTTPPILHLHTLLKTAATNSPLDHVGGQKGG